MFTSMKWLSDPPARIIPKFFLEKDETRRPLLQWRYLWFDNLIGQHSFLGLLGIRSAPSRVHMADRGMQSVTIMVAQQIVQRTLPALERRLDEVIVSKPEAIDLVLSAVQIIDSAGLTWLLSMQARLETLGIRLRLVDPSPIMSDVLLATRLDARFTIEFTGGGVVGAGAGGGNGQSSNGHSTGGTDGR